MAGYSDRINHAFAFSAKHNDQQVRSGARLPYITHPANVAVILTRYQQPDDVVIAGILHDVVEDWRRSGQSTESIGRRLADKFGETVLQLVLASTERRLDDDGFELSHEERKDDYLQRLASAAEPAHWVVAADKLHAASALASDLRRTVDEDSVWRRFILGREGTIAWYRAVLDRLRNVGFSASILPELETAVRALEAFSRR